MNSSILKREMLLKKRKKTPEFYRHAGEAGDGIFREALTSVLQRNEGMKRWIILLVFLFAALCGCAGPSEKSTSDLIRESPAAKLLLPDGSETFVDSEIASLRSFADLQIKATPLEPADREEDWLYRIVFNPSEKKIGAEEIVVSFHEDYVQIGQEFYLPEEGVSCESILEWAEGKFAYFMN